MLSDWKETCVKCMDGETEPYHCEYYGEPNGCNSPTYGEYPTCGKSSQVGNAAAMYEALENSNGLLEELALIGEWSEPARGQIAENKAALAAPPRNCDVYETKAERQSAFINWYNETFDLKGSKYAIDTCDLKHNIDDILHEYIEWLFAEAKGVSK